MERRKPAYPGPVRVLSSLAGPCLKATCFLLRSQSYIHIHSIEQLAAMFSLPAANVAAAFTAPLSGGAALPSSLPSMPSMKFNASGVLDDAKAKAQGQCTSGKYFLLSLMSLYPLSLPPSCHFSREISKNVNGSTTCSTWHFSHAKYTQTCHLG